MDVRLLGPVEVVGQGGTPISVGGPKERALLAMLAVHTNQVLSEDRLIDALWGDSPPRTAARTLQSYLSRLRGALNEASGGSVALESYRAGWTLRIDGEALDIARVESLFEAGRIAAIEGDHVGAALAFGDALGHWRGRPFDEFGDHGWAVLEAARLEEVRALIVEERVDAELACGRHAAMLPQLEAICREHPLRERPWGQRMLALYRSGRQADALRVYQDLRRTLGEELGIEPSPTTARLEQAILTHDPALEWAPSETSTIPGAGAVGRSEKVPPAVPSPAGGRRSLPSAITHMREVAFVGREAEIANLDASWKRVEAGEQEVVLIAGEPGIGKTTLAVHIAERAWKQGAVVLFGRCDEESVVPFQPFVEAVTQYVDTTAPEDLRRQLGGQAADLALLVPGLARWLPEVADIPRIGAETERYRLFEAVSDLLSAIGADAPLLLMLDDLHWADRPTLQLLTHVIRRGVGTPMLLIGTYRDTDLVRTHPMAEALVDLRRASLVARMPLRGLTGDDVRSLISAGNVPGPADSELAEALWLETEGSPLFLREILRHLSETGAVARDDEGRWLARRRIDQLGIPEGVKEVIGRRLTRLSDATNTALRTGSVLGREIRLDVLEHITDLTVDELLDAFDEATVAGVVDELPGKAGRWAFTHALVRQALYDELSLSRRVRMHQRVGEALEALNGPQAGAHLAELAFHFSQAAVAGAADKAIDYARRAAEYAITLAAYEEAARHFAMAIEVAEDAGADIDLVADLLLAQGHAEWRAGDAQVARATFERVVELAGDDPERLARAALGYAGGGVRPVWVEVWLVNERTVGLLEAGLSAIPEGDSLLRARLLACLGQELHFLAGSDERRDRLCADAVAMARRLGDAKTLADVLSARNMATMIPQHPSGMVENASEMLAIAQALGDRQLEAHALRHRAIGRCQLNDVRGTIADLDRCTELANEIKDPVGAGFGLFMQGALATLEGRFADAEAIIVAGFRTAQESRDPNAFGSYAVCALVLRFLQGRIAEMVTSVDAALQAYPRAEGFIDAATAGIYAELGMLDEARTLLGTVDLEDRIALPRNVFWLLGMGLVSRACYRLRDADNGEALYALLLPHAESNAGIFTMSVGSVHGPLALAATAAGRAEEAMAHFEAAIAANAANGWRPWVADNQVGYATLLAETGGFDERQRALLLLEEAVSTAAELGMRATQREGEQLVGALLGTDAGAVSRQPPESRVVTRRDRARAKLTATGRAAVARWTRGDTDHELVRRFGSNLAQRALFAAMARSFQPAMAFGFSGDLVFELLPPDDEVNPGAADWWTIEVRGRRAVARRGDSDNAAMTIHIGVADFVRLASGELHAVRALVDNTVEVDGDIFLAARLPDMFGIVEPIELPAEHSAL